jgi:hypothetical protein
MKDGFIIAATQVLVGLEFTGDDEIPEDAYLEAVKTVSVIILRYLNHTLSQLDGESMFLLEAVCIKMQMKSEFNMLKSFIEIYLQDER